MVPVKILDPVMVKVMVSIGLGLVRVKVMLGLRLC